MLWAALSLGWVARSVIGLLNAHGAAGHIFWGFDVLLWPMLYRWHYRLGSSHTIPPIRLEWIVLGIMTAASIIAWLTA
jgi:hypothetical protein